MPRIDDYKTAIALAAAELQQINPQRLENRTRCEYFYADGREGLLVPYFGQNRRVSWPEISVMPAAGEAQIPLTEQILILHYLNRCTGEPLSGHSIDFREVPDGGGFYWSAFVSRAKKPLLETFGPDLASIPEGGPEPRGRTPGPGGRRGPVPGLSPGAGDPRLVGRG